jgi:hypothetical protein
MHFPYFFLNTNNNKNSRKSTLNDIEKREIRKELLKTNCLPYFKIILTFTAIITVITHYYYKNCVVIKKYFFLLSFSSSFLSTSSLALTLTQHHQRKNYGFRRRRRKKFFNGFYLYAREREREKNTKNGEMVVEAAAAQS